MAKVVHKAGPQGTLKQLAITLEGLSGVSGRVGWFDSAVYPDGTPVAYIATVQEFGHAGGNIPPRLGMRSTAKEKQPEWRQVAAQGARQALKNGNPRGMLELLCRKAAGDFRKHIASVTSPELKRATLLARARKRGVPLELGNDAANKPLNDTGHMIATLDVQVTDK